MPTELTDLEQVFNAWRAGHRAPSRCLLSEVREKRLKKLLQTYEKSDLILVVRWVYESDDDRAIYLRDNRYTDLLEIFRLEKLDARLEMAEAWQEDHSPHPIVEEPRKKPAPPVHHSPRLPAQARRRI